MITNIRLKNFRAFQREVSVRLRPITVLIGRNSAGKSSLIKFLLMLRQTLESKGDSFFTTDGQHVQFGTWEDLRNTQTKARVSQDNACHFGITVETGDLPPPAIRAMWEATARGGVVTTSADQLKISIDLPYKPVQEETEKAEFDITGTVRYGTRIKHGDHAVEGRLDGKTIFKKSARNLSRVGFLRFAERTDSLDELLEGVAAERFLDSLRQEFLRPRHLSPIREESQNAVQTGSPPPLDVGHRGEYAMPHLARIITNSEDTVRASFIEKHAAAVAKVDSVNFSRRVAALVTHIEARNTETQAVCSLADFGFGVSQCLPIFIQAALHDPGQLLIVEQPEAQLHPTAQLEMGGFFAELWNERKVPSLIETHSANIILRLRKLIARGELKAEDVSVAFFTLENVADSTHGVHSAVVVKNIDIRADGSLDKGLPMEFFGADVLEALEIGSGKKV